MKAKMFRSSNAICKSGHHASTYAYPLHTLKHAARTYKWRHCFEVGQHVYLKQDLNFFPQDPRVFFGYETKTE